MQAPADCQSTAAELLPAILEQHAFIFCDPIDREAAIMAAENQADSAVVAGVAFHDSVCRGRCTLGASLSLCRIIAGNVLGTEAEDPMAVAAATDAFKEVANIITAHLLTSLFGDEVKLHIAAPDVQEIDATAWRDSLEVPGISCFDAESSPVWLSFTCTENGPSGPPPGGDSSG